MRTRSRRAPGRVRTLSGECLVTARRGAAALKPGKGTCSLPRTPERQQDRRTQGGTQWGLGGDACREGTVPPPSGRGLTQLRRWATQLRGGRLAHRRAGSVAGRPESRPWRERLIPEGETLLLAVRLPRRLPASRGVSGPSAALPCGGRRGEWGGGACTWGGDYAATKENEVWPFATTCMDLKGVKLSEVRQVDSV